MAERTAQNQRTPTRYLGLRSVSAPKRISRLAGEVSPVRRRGGTWKDNRAALGSCPYSNHGGRLRHAVAAANLSRAGDFTARRVPAKSSTPDVQELQRVQACHHLEERFHTVRLLPQRERRLPLS